MRKKGGGVASLSCLKREEANRMGGKGGGKDVRAECSVGALQPEECRKWRGGKKKVTFSRAGQKAKSLFEAREGSSKKQRDFKVEPRKNQPPKNQPIATAGKKEASRSPSVQDNLL